MPDISEKKRAGLVTPTATHQPEVVLGVVVGIDTSGAPLVDWQENLNADPVVALSTTFLGPTDLGRPVALLFAGGDASRPIILGIVRQPIDDVLIATNIREFEGQQDPGKDDPCPAAKNAPHIETRVDGESVVIEGNKEVVLKCGKASITLTSAGKILIRGTHLLNQSSGTNRIKGGSIQLN